MSTLVKFVQLAPKFPLLESLQALQGEQGATVRGLCSMLHISRPTQIQRILRNPDLRAALHHVIVDTPGGPQEVAMLESWAIAPWAAGLHISRLSPEAQEIARILKQHAHMAIAKAFSQPEVAQNETVPTTPELSSIQAAFDHIEQGFGVVQQGFEVVKEGFGELQEGVAMLKEGFGGLREHTAGMDQRLIIVEQDRLGRRLESGTKLSATQMGQLFMQLTLLREQTGLPIEAAEKRLADQFNVAHIVDIHASEWSALQNAILALFNQ